MSRPNIVLIMGDQHNADLTGGGNSGIKTPNLDRIAQNGVTAQNMFTTCPLCMPARAGIVTGRFAHSNRVRENISVLPENLPTLAGTLTKEGYTTGAFGHIGGDGIERDYHLHYDLTDGVLRKNMYDKIQYILENDTPIVSQSGVSPYDRESDGTALITDMALDFIRTNRDCPFFLHVNYYDPHPPFYPPKPFSEMVRPEDIHLPDSWRDDCADKIPNMQALRRRMVWGENEEYNLRLCLSRYYGLISYVDDQVGRILDTLYTIGLTDNTIVIYTSDHGDYAGNYGLVSKSGALYDCLLKVPLMMTAPGVDSGISLSGMAQTIDIFPTLLDLCGIRQKPGTIQGRSIADYMSREHCAGTIRDHVLASTGIQIPKAPSIWEEKANTSYYGNPCAAGSIANSFQGVSVRTQKWKFSYYNQKYMELYDVENDPSERYNLIDKADGTLLSELMRLLLDWQLDTWEEDEYTVRGYHTRIFPPEMFHES